MHLLEAKEALLFEVCGPRFCPGSIGKPCAFSVMFVLVSASCWDKVKQFFKILKILFILGTPTLVHIHSFVHRKSLLSGVPAHCGSMLGSLSSVPVVQTIGISCDSFFLEKPW